MYNRPQHPSKLSVRGTVRYASSFRGYAAKEPVEIGIRLLYSALNLGFREDSKQVGRESRRNNSREGDRAIADPNCIQPTGTVTERKGRVTQESSLQEG